MLYKRKAEKDLGPLCSLISHLRVTFRTYGYCKMYRQLLRERVVCSRLDVRKAYEMLGILTKRSPRRARTTDSRHEHPRYPNIVRSLIIERPDQVWVADTTEFGVGSRSTYLALVEDVFTRRVVGWALSFANNTLLTTAALDMALAGGTPEIHHSDQGRPYAADKHTAKLLSLGVTISMAAAGKAWENGYAERLNGSFKSEEIWLSDYQTLAQAHEEIGAYVKLYNQMRIHESLRFKTPEEVMDAYSHDQKPGEQSPL